MTPRHRPAHARRRRRQLGLLALVTILVVGGLTAVGVDLASGGSARPSSAPQNRSTQARPAQTNSPETPAPTEAPTTAAPTTSTAPTTTTTNPNETTGVLASGAIAGYLAGRSGDITAAVYDLTTGATSVWRPGAVEYTASIVKVDILATLLHQSQQQGTPLTESELDLATTMIEQSDDDAASDLWVDIGQQSGLATFNALIPLANTVPGTDGHWGGTETTALDQVSLLRTIVQPSQVLDAASRSYELGLMENIEPSEAWGVTAGVPDGVTVALKDGWLPLEDNGDWQINSIGWVDGDGHDYILAVLTKNNATEGYGIDTIQGLSQLVWNGLAT